MKRSEEKNKELLALVEGVIDKKGGELNLVTPEGSENTFWLINLNLGTLVVKKIGEGQLAEIALVFQNEQGKPDLRLVHPPQDPDLNEETQTQVLKDLYIFLNQKEQEIGEGERRQQTVIDLENNVWQQEKQAFEDLSHSLRKIGSEQLNKAVSFFYSTEDGRRIELKVIPEQPRRKPLKVNLVVKNSTGEIIKEQIFTLRGNEENKLLEISSALRNGEFDLSTNLIIALINKINELAQNLETVAERLKKLIPDSENITERVIKTKYYTISIIRKPNTPEETYFVHFKPNLIEQKPVRYLELKRNEDGTIKIIMIQHTFLQSKNFPNISININAVSKILSEIQEILNSVED